MQMERPKIELYQVRSFGEKFSATFDFLRENFRLWLRACTYLILPLCLLQGFALQSLMGIFLPFYSAVLGGSGSLDPSAGMVVRIIASYVGYFVCMTAGSVLLVGICYAMLKYYHGSRDRLYGVTMRDLKPLIAQAVKRSLVMVVLLTVLLVAGLTVLIMLAAVMKSYWLIFFSVIAAFVCMIPLSLAIPVYVFEDDETAFSSVRRGLTLGFHSFWSLLGLLFVIGLLANVLSTVTTLPWYALTLMQFLFTVSDSTQSAAAASPLYGFAQYLTAVVMNFGMYLTMSLSTFAIAFHYGSVAEDLDGFSVEEDIENFERLAGEDADIDNFERL